MKPVSLQCDACGAQTKAELSLDSHGCVILKDAPGWFVASWYARALLESGASCPSHSPFPPPKSSRKERRP
jgi:hypothetical protein